eukprot:SAG25_NODE_865_length_5016_cov_52.478137_6_plen_67_part_01
MKHVGDTDFSAGLRGTGELPAEGGWPSSLHVACSSPATWGMQHIVDLPNAGDVSATNSPSLCSPLSC